MRRVAVMAGLGVAALALSANRHCVLVWNASASAPRGLYRLIHAEQYQLGDLILTAPPAWVRALAARRGYLPDGVPLIKRIAAVASATICSNGLDIRIDGKVVGKRLLTDTKGRELPRWRGCRRLASTEEFLLMRGVPVSFDGRYFGVTPIANNLGKLVPLWTY